MQLSGPCRCVDLASMLRQACGAGQKVDLAAQEGTLLGQQGYQEACQEACQEALSSDLSESELPGGLGQQF